MAFRLLSILTTSLWTVASGVRLLYRVGRRLPLRHFLNLIVAGHHGVSPWRVALLLAEVLQRHPQMLATICSILWFCVCAPFAVLHGIQIIVEWIVFLLLDALGIDTEHERGGKSGAYSVAEFY